MQWLEMMKHSDIKICVVSNSKRERVKRFCAKYGIDCITHAKKPFSKGIRECLDKYGVEPSEENILNGSYKIQRPVLFVINRALDAAEAAFVEYIFSDAGRAIVIENGYIPAY